MSRFSRKQNTRSLKKVIRIYTEGEKTEPNYFNSIRDELRLNEIDIKVRAIRGQTLRLVQDVIKIKQDEHADAAAETEWWVVFDRDDGSKFNEAIELAQKNGIEVAYSNECFELWFILHFEFLNTGIRRDDYQKKLTGLLGRKYDKTSSDIYDLIKGKETAAIRNAKKLQKEHDTMSVSSPLKRDPSTLVYKLVEKLRELKANE